MSCSTNETEEAISIHFLLAEFTGDLDKWDNHNAIARGWRGKGDAYHPVTFRKLYNKKSSDKREE